MEDCEESTQEKFFTACRRQSIDVVLGFISSGKIDINAAETSSAGLTALHIAINYKKNGLTELLLQNGSDVHARNQQGETSLCQAITKLSPKLVKILLAHNASLTNLNNRGQSALGLIVVEKCREDQYRSRMGLEKTKKQVDIDQISNAILEHGMNLEDQSDYYKLCSVIVKDDFKSVKRLVNHFPDVNFNDSGAENPLEFAVLLERKRTVEILLRNGADPNQNPELNRDSVLMSAIWRKSPEMMELLLKFKADVNFVGRMKFVGGSAENQWTPLFYATTIVKKDLEISFNLMKQLLDHGAAVDAVSIEDGECGKTALHVACSEKFIDGVNLLASHSTNFNIPDFEKNTPLHRGVESPEITKCLLDKKADVNFKNCHGQTPLHFACMCGLPGTIELLLESGAKLTATDNRGRTVLHYAASNDDTDIFVYVANRTIRPGIININVRDRNGQTSLHQTSGSVEQCKMFVELLKRGADPNIRSKSNHCPEHEHDSDEEEIWDCPVLEYAQRLEMIGYKVDEECVRYEKILEDVASNCELELEKLKKEVIVRVPRRTLFDVLFMSRGVLTRCSENEDIEEVFKKCEKGFEQDYSYYGSLLNTQLYRGQNRKKMMEPAKEYLDRVLGHLVPHICSNHIFKYLDNAQLKLFGKRKFSFK